MRWIHFSTNLGILEDSFLQIFSIVFPNTTSFVDDGITFCDSTGDTDVIAFTLPGKSYHLRLENGDIFGDTFD